MRALGLLVDLGLWGTGSSTGFAGSSFGFCVAVVAQSSSKRSTCNAYLGCV